MSPALWLKRIVLPFVLTRAALLIVGGMALVLLGSARGAMPGNLVAHSPAPVPLEIWARWDSEWYLLIAERGYDAGDALRPFSPAYRPEDTTGFFPLYPLLVSGAIHLGFPPVAAGVLISNVALLAALTLLYLLARDEWGDEAAGTAVWILSAFPFSLFLSAVYSESLALALILGAFLSARRRRWALLAVCGFCAGLARPTALLAAPALAWEVKERDGGWRGWLSLLGFPAGIAVFCAYCADTFHEPLVWAVRQQRWRGPSSWPGRAFTRFLESSPHLHGAHDSILELCVAMVFLLSMIPVLRKAPRSWATYTVLCVLLPLSSTLWSFGRLSLMTFPVFASVGDSLRRAPSGLPAYLSLSLPLGGFLMTLFACGWWAG